MNLHRASMDVSKKMGGLLGALNSTSTARRASSIGIYNSTMSQQSQYEVVERGTLHTLDYRIFIRGPKGFVSPWHDIPLFANEKEKIFNMIVEIPRWTNAKMEMATADLLSPIKQDKKSGLPRFVNNIFPHHGYIWNYGALPQTWEDPNYKDPNTNANGDNDPIDIVEIGSKIHPRGSVIQVKVVGVLGMLDDGETDWKLVGISVDDPVAEKVNDIGDVERHFPGLLTATHEWFRIYKIPTGKPANTFAFNGEFKDAQFAYKIIDENHEAWQKLIKTPNSPLNTESHVEGAAHPADDGKWKSIVESFPQSFSPQPVPEEVNKWYFISSQ